MIKTKILIADDHILARKIVRLILIKYEDQFEINEVADGQQVIDFCEIHPPDLLIMDFRMPILNGYEVAEILMKKNYKIKIILLTNFDEITIILRFLKLGVNGFLFKGCDPDDVIVAVREVLDGKRYFHSRHESEILRHIENGITANLPSLQFSEQEKKILLQISTGKTSAEIANHLNVSMRTVETYRFDLLRKTQVKNTSELIDYIYRNGIYITRI